VTGSAPGPTLSAALSLHNSGKYIRPQLDSILTQTRPPEQIVVGDDGSTDGSIDHVYAAVERSRELGLEIEWTILDQTKVGAKNNMERIIAACTREVVVICDHDDINLPKRFEEVAEKFAARPGLYVLCADAEVIDSDGVTTAPSMFAASVLNPVELAQLHSDEAFRLLVRRMVAAGASTAFRKSLRDIISPRREPLHYDAWYSLLAAAMMGFAIDDRPAIRYRVHRSNASGGVRRRTRLEKFRMLLEPGGERNATLLARTEAVLAGVEAIRDRVPDWAYDLAAGSAQHERVRTSYPTNRILRAGHVMREARTGAYERFARGRKDVLLDLVQPR
jgi:Glycosyl transferase family 2